MQIKTWFSALLMAAVTSFVLVNPAQASPVSGQGTWETTLQPRDLDGNGVTDAFYDTTLNLTWLRNANVNGEITWDVAHTWAAGYSIGGYSDWRLPTMVDTDAPGCDFSHGGTDCGFKVLTTGESASGIIVYSEMASLWYNTLGNEGACSIGNTSCQMGPQPVRGLTNTGEFQNLQPGIYWSGLEYEPMTDSAWVFRAGNGVQSNWNKDGQFYALAVRRGDVVSAQVPEPAILALALTALAGLGFVRRRRTVGSLAL